MSVPTKRLGVAGSLALCCLSLCSCGEQEGFRKETSPLTGEVYVNGEPAAQLQVTCHNVQGIDTEHPTFSSAITDESGKFSISTYEAADGVPEGEYVLTFGTGSVANTEQAGVHRNFGGDVESPRGDRKDRGRHVRLRDRLGGQIRNVFGRIRDELVRPVVVERIEGAQ